MDIAQILIFYIHAPLGFIALLTGGIALIVKKGGKVHKRMGRVFYYSMLTSAIAAFVISVLPNHTSPFLFSIGLFSSYFLISGLRSLFYKRPSFSLQYDKLIAYLILITGIGMILYPVVLYQKLNIILAVFGIVGVGFGFRDLKMLKQEEETRKNWLPLHVGKMTGGYIAACSAFFVVNEILPGIWNWFVPGIIGSVYISYWMSKLNKAK